MQLDHRWAALPTVTATAKPAVSPVADKVRAGVPPATFAPSVVDGGREVARPGLIALLEAAVGAIFRIGPGSVMKAISRMSPPHAGHSSGNSSPTRARSFAQAIREVSCERGFA